MFAEEEGEQLLCEGFQLLFWHEMTAMLKLDAGHVAEVLAKRAGHVGDGALVR